MAGAPERDPWREAGFDRGVLPGARSLEVYTAGAAFYVACLKNRYFEEANEFAEWFMETFDLDLET